MFVKLVYQELYSDGSQFIRGESLKECDEVYFESCTGTLLALEKDGKQELIDMETMEKLPQDYAEDNSNPEQPTFIIMAYVMNDNGKTIDSYKLKL
jgi:hypothetical protein